ncbi:hypothetical protein NEOLEDRAFT_622950 [Neolentinus lepideus HHB14362 ss-1]|uniref:Uncharacterized protein n=1 Tax=Neolentinus lepideus HHB14362 ss-1 TaxID=1314782 RepID=A0A165QTD5_9AGAM|nr:hypothetical protein NEOLEDRAFT_622950 [Neolentinus lepideus HHB14362 ss-1]
MMSWMYADSEVKASCLDPAGCRMRASNPLYDHLGVPHPQVTLLVWMKFRLEDAATTLQAALDAIGYEAWCELQRILAPRMIKYKPGIYALPWVNECPRSLRGYTDLYSARFLGNDSLLTKYIRKSGQDAQDTGVRNGDALCDTATALRVLGVYANEKGLRWPSGILSAFEEPPDLEEFVSLRVQE